MECGKVKFMEKYEADIILRELSKLDKISLWGVSFFSGRS